MKPKVVRKFWERVDMSAGPDACWPWQGVRLSSGYGRAWDGVKTSTAHRVALRIKLGRELGNMMCALHACDNPPCCNPRHLWEGTKQDNHDDMTKKGREARGDRHGAKTQPEKIPRGQARPNAKLTDERVREIRRLRDVGMCNLQELAVRFGVSSDAIACVVKDKTWTHVV